MAPARPGRHEARPTRSRLRPINAAIAKRGAAEDQARRHAEEARGREEFARAHEILATTAYFDYDSFQIRDDSRQLLDAKVPILRASPAVRLRISGHADERGSTEYNMALGMRRALAAKEYLTNFGLADDQFEAISFGEERPLATGQSEEALARNRRTEFEVTSALSGGR